MKIRTDFVTNSSSSSFTLLIRMDIKGKKPIQYKTTSGVGEGDEDYYQLVATKCPEELGDAESIDELITMLKESIGQDGLYGDGPEDPENRVLTDETPFIKQIRKLSSMDDISKITITGNLDGRDEYWHRTYTYDMTTGMMEKEEDGEDFDAEGTGGGLEFNSYSDLNRVNIDGRIYYGSKKGIEAKYQAFLKEYEEYKTEMRKHLQRPFEEYLEQALNGFKYEKYLADDIDVEFAGKKFSVDKLTFRPEISKEIEQQGGKVFSSFGKTSDYYIIGLGSWKESWYLSDAIYCIKNGSGMKMITEYQVWRALWKVPKTSVGVRKPVKHKEETEESVDAQEDSEEDEYDRIKNQTDYHEWSLKGETVRSREWNQEFYSKFEKYVAEKPKIEFCKKKFVFSGMLGGLADKDEAIVRAVLERGGEYRTSISGVTDYLVIESLDCAGESKMNAAVKQIENGKPLQIITADALIAALDGSQSIDEQRKESLRTVSEAKREIKRTGRKTSCSKQADIRKNEQSDTKGSWRDQYIQKEIEPDEEETWTPATDFIYVNNGEDVQINGYTGPGGFVRIPDRIEGNPVTRIAAQAFSGNKTITGLILPKELRFVGNNAFYLCQNLTGTLVIPTNVITLENSAFFWTNFTDIVIRASCKIAGSAFANINNLKAVFIQKGCSPSIGYADFARSPAFVTFIIPEEVKEIQEKNCEACNLVTIYTPADSCASDYAKQNFIRCNTEDYEKIYDEYAERYSSSPKRIQEDSKPGIIQKEFHEELEEELLPDEQQDEIYTPEEFGENVWHSVDGTDYEFRVFGFAGEETPIIIQVRDAETKKLIGTTIETVDFSETAPEGDYEIITDYEVEDIEALSPESFRFNWCATFVQNGMKLYDTYSEITINLDPDPEAEETDSSENGQKATDVETISEDELRFDDPEELETDDNTQNASFETTVNEKVREEFKRQIREKKSELESLVIKGENIQKEIELLEDMLRRKMDSQ